VPTIEQAPPAADDAGAVVVVDVVSLVVVVALEEASDVVELAAFVGVLESREQAVAQRASKAMGNERRIAKTKSRSVRNSRPNAHDGAYVSQRPFGLRLTGRQRPSLERDAVHAEIGEGFCALRRVDLETDARDGR
jgi:hypothetical protein